MKRILSALFLVCLSGTAGVFAQEDATREAQMAAVIAVSAPETFQTMESPDQAYSATVTVYPCVDIDGQAMSYERLDVIDLESNEAHLVAEQLLSCEGLGAAGLQAMRWSNNGAYLYYTDAREGQPDGLVIDWVPPVTRVQIEDWTVHPLGQAKFSPDGGQIVAWNNEVISVLSVEADEVTSYAVSPGGLQIINMMWLPDLSGIVYVQADSPIMAARSTVIYIDLALHEQTVLLDTAN